MVCKMEEVTSPAADSDTLDLSNQNLEKLSRATPELILNTTTLLLDNNSLTRLDNIHTYQCIEKLSVSNNKLLRMFQVSKLQHLKVLDLSNNNIATVEGLKDIKLLTWLSLAENNIKSIENLNYNVHLEYIDLASNQINYVMDISSLKNLKSLFLHKNKISDLRSCGQYLPASLTTLTLSENELQELGDVSHLSHLSRLDQLTLADNPCIQQPSESEKQYDYRPYVINWCLNLRMLDGISVSPKESLKAEWMYSQSKGRQFGAGEQDQLVDYLVQTCPLDPNLETEQDRKLNLILSKVQEHQSSLRQTRQDGCSTLPRSASTESKKSAPSTPRRNSGPTILPASIQPATINSNESFPEPSERPHNGTNGGQGQPGVTGYSSTPSSVLSTPVNTPGLPRRNSTGVRSTRFSRLRSSPSSLRKSAFISPSQYNLELPPTLYGEDMTDVVNGNDLMTQSMDPSVLSERLDNSSMSDSDLMSQSVDANTLRNNLNERFGVGVVGGGSANRPRSLFSQRGSTDSGIRSDEMDVLELSEGEQGSILSSFSRLQSRLNPVPESLNSPDIIPGPSPPRRDDPLHTGPLSSLPLDLELKLNATKNGNHDNQTQTRVQAVPPSSLSRPTPATNNNLSNSNSNRSQQQQKQISPRPSDVMVAAVTARISTQKTSNNPVIARPTSAVKPMNITSKVDSGLNRGGPGRSSLPRSTSKTFDTPTKSKEVKEVKEGKVGGSRSLEPTSRPRSQSAGPNRKGSLPHRQVAALRSGSSTAAPTPETSRKRLMAQPLSLADDEASDTETECRKQTEPATKSRPRRQSQESPTAKTRSSGVRRVDTWRSGEQNRRTNDSITKSASSMNVGASRLRSTSLTRSQSVRIGRGGMSSSCSERSISRSERSSSRPRSSTLSSPGQRENVNTSARSIQATWRGHTTRTRDPQVQDIKEEMRSMRLEAHVKQLSKELRNARSALEQERKLRKAQTDTIRVLWKEVQTLQYENDLDLIEFDSLSRQEANKNMSKKSQQLQRLDRSIGRLGNPWQEDSDSSRGEELLGEVGSGSSTSGVEEKSVADLSRTCASLQSQVESLQASLATVVRYVSERSRHSSSSTCTPPLPNSTPPLPSSMTMSLPPSLTLPNPVTISRSCDSLAQTDIVAVKTPQAEAFPFTSRRQAFTDVDTSDSDHTRLDVSYPIDVISEGISTSMLPDRPQPSPARSRSRSPRPHTLPGVGHGDPAPLKKGPPRGSHIPGMRIVKEAVSPPGPKFVKTFASGLVQGILSLSKKEISERITVDTVDDITDISMSLDITECPTPTSEGVKRSPKESSTNQKDSPASSLQTVDSDSLEKSPELKQS